MPVTPEEHEYYLSYGAQCVWMGMMPAAASVSGARQARHSNVAVLELRHQGNMVFRKTAISCISCLDEALRGGVYSPSVPASRTGAFGIAPGTQNANHTEPKLLEDMRRYMEAGGGPFDLILLASQRDCCSSCVKYTVSALTEAALLHNVNGGSPVRFIVVELETSRVREGDEFF